MMILRVMIAMWAFMVVVLFIMWMIHYFSCRNIAVERGRDDDQR